MARKTSKAYSKKEGIALQIPAIDIKKYGGKQVALVDGKIVAEGRTTSEVIKKARMKAPKRPLRDIKILAVPKTLHVIHYYA